MTPIEPGTTIHDLLEAHPYLLDFLGGYHPHFQRLLDPAHREQMAQVATVEIASGAAGVPVSQFVADLRAEVERHEGGEGASAAPVGVERRHDVLRSLIHELHAGVPFEDVKARFSRLIEEVDPGEIAAMEQALMAEGMPAEEIQRLCDVHVAVFRDSLDVQPGLDVPPGHPVHTFLAENRVAAELMARLRCSLEEVAAAPGDAGPPLLAGIRGDVDRLGQIDVHYLRKENQLFPPLERHGITGPTRVMWALHDDIRLVLKEVRAAFDAQDSGEVVRLLDQLLTMLEDMIYKEEKILFPTSLQALSDQEWAEIRAGDDAIGYAWVTPAADFGPGSAAAGRAAGGAAPAGELLLPLTTGALTPDRLDLVLRALPFDLTVVDEHDEVRYYSEGERVFPRSPAVIGRKVQHCHPPKSVHVVERILEEFKAGAKSRADFWIELGERFILIRYFALRDPDSTYRGVLEVVQDVTWVRGLEGQRRLLDW